VRASPKGDRIRDVPHHRGWGPGDADHDPRCRISRGRFPRRRRGHRGGRSPEFDHCWRRRLPTQFRLLIGDVVTFLYGRGYSYHVLSWW